jgi:3-oxoacyl-[acyl-carrier-protein] synthase III
LKSYIKAIDFHLPENTLSNANLQERFPEWDEQKITDKLGISTRHIAAENQTALDLAVAAAEKLFEKSGIGKAEIDFVLFCTQSPDYLLPTSACIIQNTLGLPKSCGALDFNLGCSGYVYGLALANGLLATNAASNVLLLTSDTYSKFIDPFDKSNLAIFGDAGTATIVSNSGMLEIGKFVFGTDGSGSDKLIFPNSACRVDVNQNKALVMDGSAVFNFTLDAVPNLVRDVLSLNSFCIQDISLFIFHQANSFMLETLRKVCGIQNHQFYCNMAATGNTVSSTIPIALSQLLNSQKIVSPMTLLLAGFGVGYSWAGTVVKS